MVSSTEIAGRRIPEKVAGTSVPDVSPLSPFRRRFFVYGMISLAVTVPVLAIKEATHPSTPPLDKAIDRIINLFNRPK